MSIMAAANFASATFLALQSPTNRSTTNLSTCSSRSYSALLNSSSNQARVPQLSTSTRTGVICVAAKNENPSTETKSASPSPSETKTGSAKAAAKPPPRGPKRGTKVSLPPL
eukprot:TRINITY_DN1463_c0_g1_i2.p1 TRINITY_DN1463_c0_g1~~TRINITY_DN1463_c0_g1_i2.p1  ORF type:complete len:112 (+),score=28.18 TRINITY_DN1463_c0_g1_i2:170-505(+)